MLRPALLALVLAIPVACEPLLDLDLPGDGDGDGDGDGQPVGVADLPSEECAEWPPGIEPGIPCVSAEGCAIAFDADACPDGSEPLVLEGGKLCVHFISGECASLDPCPGGWADLCG